LRPNIVLIDFESVQPGSLDVLAADHFRLKVFVGATQNKLPFNLVTALQRMGKRAEYIKIAGVGPNALDFHIAYYIGKLSAAHPDAYFHIISKDKGFDPLIKHLKDQKVFCGRSESVLEIPLVKSTDKLTPKQRAADFYEKRIASAKSRPATVSSLQSTILSHFHKLLSAEEVTKVQEALTAAGLVVVNGKKVAYPDRGS